MTWHPVYWESCNQVVLGVSDDLWEDSQSQVQGGCGHHQHLQDFRSTPPPPCTKYMLSQVQTLFCLAHICPSLLLVICYVQIKGNPTVSRGDAVIQRTDPLYSAITLSHPGFYMLFTYVQRISRLVYQQENEKHFHSWEIVNMIFMYIYQLINKNWLLGLGYCHFVDKIINERIEQLICK